MVVSLDSSVLSSVHDFLAGRTNDEPFHNVLHYDAKVENNRIQAFRDKMVTLLTDATADQKTASLRVYLKASAVLTNHSEMKTLLESLAYLVEQGSIPPLMLCDQILDCKELVHQNQNFWIECIRLIKSSLTPRKNSYKDIKDYKEIREIMKDCCERAQSFPTALTANTLPQMTALEEVIEYIFDRQTCLLPAYLIVNEVKKTCRVDTHWKLTRLITDFIQEFRDTAQMLTVIGHSEMLPIIEHFSYQEHMFNPWRLDPATLKFHLKGNLPYDQDVTQPQRKLLRHLLGQAYSTEMVSVILNLQKQQKERCESLEEQLVWVMMMAMEKTEALDEATLTGCAASTEEMGPHPVYWLWLHLSSQLIYFLLFHFAVFPNIVNAFIGQLSVRKDLRKGRDYLMWALLQFTSGSIQRYTLSSFLCVLELCDILYAEQEPLPVPDTTKSCCARQMAATCIWIHVVKKAQSESVNLNRTIPKALTLQHTFLQEQLSAGVKSVNDYRSALLCNAHSTNKEYFLRTMGVLVDPITNQKNLPLNSSSSSSTGQAVAGGSAQAGGVVSGATPLSVVMLDSLTVHCKMSLIHAITANILKNSHAKTNVSSVSLETYSRLMIYSEIESLGIKSYLTTILPTVFKANAWGILYTLLEMFSYRVNHISPQYRVQFLSHLPALASVPHTNQMQLHLCMESTALRLITGLGSADVQSHISRYLSESKTGIAESEELNRALVLTLARAMHITGSGSEATGSGWCKDLLNGIMQYTPLSWSPYTLLCFPPVLSEFFAQNPVPKENKQLLKKSVEEEYRNWVSMDENDIIAHFSVAMNPPLFLCLVFKMIFETNGISPVAYKILERIGARGISVHLRKLIDYLLFELTSSGVSAHVNKCVDTINDMIWKYNVITIDRFVLCLALRTQEGNGAQLCFFIIQLVLLKSNEFRNRIQDFVKENSPEHWKQNNWHEKNFAFHQKYPEKFSPDESHGTLPMYFGNVCLRFIPVLDIVINRFLEAPIPAILNPFDAILEHLGCLYKFHDRPVTYLYNTLHYYERKLRDCPMLKKKLVTAVIGSFKEVRPPNWALTDAFLTYLAQDNGPASATTTSGGTTPTSATDNTSTAAPATWQPELSYYVALVRRLVESIDGDHIFFMTDWRFNEFFNPAAHALYVTCVELLALPVRPQSVASSLFDVIVKGYPCIPSKKVPAWINAIGLIFAKLPEAYWAVMYDRLQEVLLSAPMLNWTYRYSPFEMFNFRTVTQAMLDRTYVSTLAVSQSILHHLQLAQLGALSEHVREKLKPIVRTEEQLLYVCHVVSPSFARLDKDYHRQLLEVTTVLYELIQIVDVSYGPSKPLKYMDTICDLLYHIKYMFVGDSMKSELEKIIRCLRPSTQKRLRFMTRMNVEEIEAPQSEKSGGGEGKGDAVTNPGTPAGTAVQNK